MAANPAALAMVAKAKRKATSFEFLLHHTVRFRKSKMLPDDQGWCQMDFEKEGLQRTTYCTAQPLKLSRY